MIVAIFGEKENGEGESEMSESEMIELREEKREIADLMVKNFDFEILPFNRAFRYACYNSDKKMVIIDDIRKEEELAFIDQQGYKAIIKKDGFSGVTLKMKCMLRTSITLHIKSQQEEGKTLKDIVYLIRQYYIDERLYRQMQEFNGNYY